MSKVIPALRTDHSNFVHLLDLLEGQLDESMQVEGQADYALMQDIMLYMTRYPDLYHHPKEDLVFTRLVARDASARSIVDELMNQHKTLAEKGTRLFETLRNVVDGEMVRRDTLDAQGRDYLSSMRSHIDTEESQVFRMAERLLPETDWADVDNAMEHMEDPLFGKIVGKEYRDLYEFVIQESK